tara:strand:- start:143 stop:688 length:546 start_codon:yes stop_codon:yes gene_type:complete
MNESNSGMMTKIWGPAGWLFLHSVTMGYPSVINKDDPEHIKRMKSTRDFFILVSDVLPCRYCRDSYKQYIKELPIEDHLDTRKKLAKWLYDIHNKVNDKLDVKEYPSFESVYDRYESYRAKCTKTKEKKTKGCIHSKHGSPKKCIIKIEDDLNKLLDNGNNFNFENMNFTKHKSGYWVINL